MNTKNQDCVQRDPLYFLGIVVLYFAFFTTKYFLFIFYYCQWMSGWLSFDLFEEVRSKGSTSDTWLSINGVTWKLLVLKILSLAFSGLSFRLKNVKLNPLSTPHSQHVDSGQHHYFMSPASDLTLLHSHFFWRLNWIKVHFKLCSSLEWFVRLTIWTSVFFCYWRILLVR